MNGTHGRDDRDAWLLAPPRRLTAVLVGMAMLSLLGLAVLPSRLGERSAAIRNRLERVDGLLVHANRIETDLTRQVAAAHGLVLAPDARFPGEITRAAPARAQTLEAMRSLGLEIDDPRLGAAIERVADLVSGWDGNRGEATEGSAALAVEQARYGEVLVASAALGQAADTLLADLHAGLADVEAMSRRVRAGLLGGALLCLGLLAWLAWRVSRTAAALGASERRLRSTFEHAGVGIAHVAPDGRWLRVNARLCEILGYTPEDLCRLTFQDLTHPADLAADLEQTGRLLGGEIPRYTMQKRYVRGDGSIVWCNLTAAVVRTADGRPEYGIAVLEDITERLRLEAERASLLGLEQAARTNAEREMERSRLLQSITGALAGALRPEDVADVVVSRVVRSLGARYGFIVLPAGTGDRLEIIGASKLPHPIAEDWPAISIDAAIPLAQAYRTGAPLFFEGDRTIPDAALRSTLERLGVCAAAILPLSLGTHTIGAMTFDFGEPRRFEEADREILGAVANAVAQALDRARLFEAERARTLEAEAVAGRLDRLQSVTAALTGALTRSEVAAVLAREGRDALEAHAAAVALRTADGRSLEFLGWDGYPADLRADWQGLPITLDSPLTHAVRTGEAYWLGREAEWVERFGPVPLVPRMIPSRAWAAIPLSFEGRVLGGLVLSFPQPCVFTDQDRALGTAIAQLGAQALERARLYEDAEHARRQAEAGVRARDQFLAATSHELRGPLTELIGALETLSTAPPDTPEIAAQARAGAWRFASVVDSMLALANADDPERPAASELVDVAGLTRELGLAFEPAARRLGMALRIEAPGTPVLVYADPRKLRPIVYHLLDNAIKFARRGEVTLRVQMIDGETSVSVRDEGPGIPPDRLDHIFEPFTHLDASHTRERGGAGIGLALARRFARALGGNLTVESKPGAGSTFVLHLPRHDDAPAGADARVGARVLVVDDEAPIRSVVVRALRRSGFIADERPDADAALARLERESFDLLLTDISMPGRSGLWLADQVRGRWPAVAVMLMSGAELTAGEVGHAARLGCPFISKPFEPRMLVAAIRDALATRTALPEGGPG